MKYGFLIHFIGFIRVDAYPCKPYPVLKWLQEKKSEQAYSISPSCSTESNLDYALGNNVSSFQKLRISVLSLPLPLLSFPSPPGPSSTPPPPAREA